MFPLDRVTNEDFTGLMRGYLGLSTVRPITHGHYRAYVGYGNNCNLIKKILKERGYWVIVDRMEDDPHFVWTQLKVQSFIDKKLKK